MPVEIIARLREKGMEVIETSDLKQACQNSDLVYMTRIQKERFTDLSEYEKVKGSYVINEDFLKQLNKKIVILHPLPRVDEISPAVDEYSGAAYFRQVRNGVYVRMALLAMVMGKTVKPCCALEIWKRRGLTEGVCRMESKLAVLAIGGNSLIKDKNHIALSWQYEAVKETGQVYCRSHCRGD